MSLHARTFVRTCAEKIKDVINTSVSYKDHGKLLLESSVTCHLIGSGLVLIRDGEHKARTLFVIGVNPDSAT